MNFNRDNQEYVKWAKAHNVPTNAMPQQVWPKIFECLNKLMSGSPEVVAPVPVEQDKPDFNKMGDDALRKYIDENDGKYHHMNKRDKLISIAKGL